MDSNNTPTRKTVRLVTFSGGSGHSVLLQGLKNLPQTFISAVVAMTDNGKSSGILRKELGILPPGDIRRCLGALATKQPELAQALELRFTEGFLKGHTFGNILLATLTQTLGNFDEAVRYTHSLFGIQGQVIPCTIDLAHLHAELTDGSHLVGEEQIDITESPSRPPIKKVWVEPQAFAHPQALAAIAQADFLIFGPGDFYTSIIASILVDGMSHAIQQSTAKKILVCNRTQKLGETAGLTATDLVEQLEHYLETKIDILIGNNQNEQTGPLPPVQIDAPALEQRGVQVVLTDLADVNDGVRLDGKKIANAIYDLYR